MTSRALIRTALGAALVAIALVWLDASGTLGGFTSAVVTNSTDTASVGSLSFSHSYSGNTCAASAVTPSIVTSCPSSVYPATAPSGTTTASAMDAITNTGSFPATSITGTARVASCGPVQFANSVTGGTSGAMLPRVGTTFAPTTGPFAGGGSASFNGSTGYASSVTATTEPTGGLLQTASFGLGIWFRTAATSISPLFGFGSNPLAVAGTNDRVLYLDATGKLAFLATQGGTPIVSTGTTAYNDNVWHFAYVQLGTANLGLNYSVSVSVDNKTVATYTSPLFTGLSAYLGYWHLGWSPVGGTGRYFTGSLSGFTVDDSGTAPAAPVANPTSYTSFDTTRTQQWPLNDSGGTFDGSTTTGVLPGTTALPGNAAGPCDAVTIAWSTTSPASTVTTTTQLSAMVSKGYVAVAVPAPGVTQTSTITLGRTTVANTYVPGLIVYAPVQLQYTAGSWSVGFTWNASAPGTAPGSTFVVSP